jgi:hypothetical protein
MQKEPADRAADANREGALVPVALRLIERRVSLVVLAGIVHVLVRVAVAVPVHETSGVNSLLTRGRSSDFKTPKNPFLGRPRRGMPCMSADTKGNLIARVPRPERLTGLAVPVVRVAVATVLVGVGHGRQAPWRRGRGLCQLDWKRLT